MVSTSRSITAIRPGSSCPPIQECTTPSGSPSLRLRRRDESVSPDLWCRSAASRGHDVLLRGGLVRSLEVGAVTAVECYEVVRRLGHYSRLAAVAGLRRSRLGPQAG